MKSFFQKTLTMALAFLFVIGSLQATAQSLSELQKKKNEADASRNSLLSALKDAQNQKNEILAELIEMDLAIADLEAELEFASSELEKTTIALNNAEKELIEANTLREQQQDALVKRLRVMDEIGFMSYVEMLFNSKSILDFLDKYENVKTIAEYDKNLYAQLEDTENKISETVAFIEKSKRELELLKTQTENKLAELEKSVEAKHERVLALEADEAGYEQLASELKTSSDELAKLIKAKAEEEAKKQAAKQATATTASVKYEGGVFQWPVKGYTTISSGYGNRKDPFTKRTAFHTGIDIPAPRGTNIAAAANGTVIFSAWKDGYGYCVIIDHGQNLSTLYAHASTLNVSVGDTVTKGQTIAKIGSTGRSTGNHLHFEVRINGNYTNPMSYLGR